MRKNTSLAAGIVVMFVALAFMPACTSIEQVKPIKVSPLGEPKLEKTWKYRYIGIFNLYDANFTKAWFSPGFISQREGAVGWMVGTFLKVKITGTVKFFGHPWYDTNLTFKLTQFSKTGIDMEDLSIVEGNYIEITASMVFIPYLRASTGRIYNNQLYLEAPALDIDLKVYDTPPQ
jgi:hypothetical protein